MKALEKYHCNTYKFNHSYAHEKSEKDINKRKEQLMQEVSSFRITNKIKSNKEGLTQIESLDVNEDVKDRLEKLMIEIETD